jgi:hypothetical protein
MGRVFQGNTPSFRCGLRLSPRVERWYISAMDDTHPAAARRQIELLRETTASRRATLALSLSRTVIDLSRRALRARMPGATEREVMLRWVEQNYGVEIGQRLRQHLAARET